MNKGFNSMYGMMVIYITTMKRCCSKKHNQPTNMHT